MDWQQVSLAVVEQLKYYYPLPWRIDQDWTVEVWAANGRLALKCQTIEDARKIIGLASNFSDTQVTSWDAIGIRLLGHLLVEHRIPWRIAPSGSTWEVLASDDARILVTPAKILAEQVVEYSIQSEADMLALDCEWELEMELMDQQEGPFKGFRQKQQEKRRQDPDYDPGT